MAALVELRVFETDAAELEIAGEHLTIVSRKRGFVISLFVDDLGDSNDFVIRVFDGQTEH